MKTMIKSAAVLAVICLLASPAMASLGYNGAGYYAGAADYARVAGHYQGNGGEFTLYDHAANSAGYTTNLSLSNSAYAAVAKNRGSTTNSFQTFCMEVTEHVYAPMHVYVSQANIDGTAGSHAWKGSTGIGDNLDSKTAWLYTKFATGTLTGYDYDPAGNRAASAGALQRLIWATENEGGINLVLDNEYQGIKLTQFQVDLINTWNTEFAASNWTGIGNVRVLQMYQGTWDSGTVLQQDMLYLVPAPGAAVLAFLGLGIVGWVKRRMA